MRSRPWLANVRHLLGKLPDAEIAKRAGVSATTILNVRRELGIAAREGRDLDLVGAKGTLKLVRARSRSGDSMRQIDVRDARLLALCRRFYGSWYVAVAAAGLKPAGKPRRVARPPPRKRKLTDALLRGKRTSAELERMTGVAADLIRRRRRSRGIERDETNAADRSWVPSVRRRLGKLPDADIARLLRKSGGHVSDVRSKLGIAAAPVPSRASSQKVRDWLRRASKTELRAAIADLDADDLIVFRERYLRRRPTTLAVIGKRLGVSRQRVAQRERRAIVEVLARLRA